MHKELKIKDMKTLESNKKTIEESTNPISIELPDLLQILTRMHTAE